MLNASRLVVSFEPVHYVDLLDRVAIKVGRNYGIRLRHATGGLRLLIAAVGF
jgi:hypothetical protein